MSSFSTMYGQHVVMAVLLWFAGTLNGSFANDEELLFTTIDRCGEGPLIDNGDIVQRSRVYLKYQCRANYSVYGENTVLCLSNGSWSELPRCIASPINSVSDDKIQSMFTTIDRCGTPPPIDHGVFYTDENSNMFVTYQCNDFYKLRRNSKVMCYANGNWTERPTCIEETACFDPEIPNASYTEVSYVAHREKLWIRCNTGYEDKNRRATALCENGEWKVLPVCEKIEGWCGPPPQISNTVIVNQVYKEMFPEDAEVEYKCQDGSELETPNSKAYCSYGQWQSLPSCTPPINTGSDDKTKPMLTTTDHCGIPPPIDHAEFSYDENNMFVKYQCNIYYKLNGRNKVMCYGNGQWSELPTCEVNFCTLDTSRYDHLENKGDIFVMSGTKVKLACLDVKWRTARAECKNNQLHLTECCLTITHNVNNCGYVQLKK